ncbi:MAG: class I SAM-dependent methyltransferase [Burkholderiales bacterium]|nr:class I SAM-dependent methyltransferase [Burkholderiales bacterium]
MTEATENSYDRLPYTSNAFSQTLPDRTGAIARLFGMMPAPAADARVLEIGCASGGNLLPMSARWPRAKFVGIDLSARQIADGQALVSQLGLANVELRHMDLKDVDQAFGLFDYIIVHGVYSWVPSTVQDRLFGICKHNLAPQGVAYLSYNTNPGWRMRGMIRDMMVYHTRQFPDMTVRVQQARALLDFLGKFVPTENDPYGLVLKRELEALRQTNDSYLAHEHLEEVNEPVYFHQFAERASTHGLQYLGEAEFHTMLASNFPPEAAETLRSIAPNIVQMEQYMDFLRNRAFRQTLLVHQGIVLNRNLNWRNVEGLHAASPMRPVEATVDIRSTAQEKYQYPNGGMFVTPEPIAKAAMQVLGERWPQTIGVADLRQQARARLAAAGASATAAELERDSELVGSDMLRCFAAGLVELRSESPPVSLVVGERPRAGVMARHQAAQGTLITNLRHEPVNLDEFGRQLLRHLNGERDHAALIAVLADLTAKDVLQIRKGEQTVRDPAVVLGVIQKALPQGLARLARAGLIAA